MTAVSVLGDSLTCGRGVGVRVAEDQTWPALLARSVPGVEVCSLARPGARIADLRRSQLPGICASRAKGGVVILIAGLNDICRSGFDRAGIQRELSLIVSQAQAGGSSVMLARLHNPAKILGLQGAVARAVTRRWSQVNDAVDEVAAASREVLVIDLASVPALASPGGWAVDRIHPSAAGHHGIAFAVAAVLAGAGLAERSRLAPPCPAPAPSVIETAWWAIRHGLPYGLSHLPDFGPPLVAALASAGR